MKILLSSLFRMCILGVACLLLSCNLNHLIFQPYKKYGSLPDPTTYSYEVVHFPSRNGKLLEGWFFKPLTEPSKGTVLHLHGNSHNISFQFPRAAIWVDKGYQLFTFDYQGYGKSDGFPSQQHVLEDALAAFDYLLSRSDIHSNHLILFGQSLGGHLSIVVASKIQEKLEALVVESPFTDYKSIMMYHANRFFVPTEFSNSQLTSLYSAMDVVHTITIPKLFIHSPTDSTVPFFMGESLYEKAIQPKLFWVSQAKHANASIEYPDVFYQHVLRVLK